MLIPVLPHMTAMRAGIAPALPAISRNSATGAVNVRISLIRKNIVTGMKGRTITKMAAKNRQMIVSAGFSFFKRTIHAKPVQKQIPQQPASAFSSFVIYAISFSQIFP